MITRTKATTSKTTHKPRTRRQKPTIEQKRSFTLLTLSLGAIVCVFSSVLSSLLSDRIRFRIGKIASLSTLINPSSSVLGARKSELRREKQAQLKSSSRTRRREVFESVKERKCNRTCWCCRHERERAYLSVRRKETLAVFPLKLILRKRVKKR